MENKVAKKKKYVKVKNPNETSQRQTSEANTEGDEALTLFRSRFDYNFHQIVNHILAKLIPDSRFNIKQSEKLIFGHQKQIDQLMSKLDDNIKYYSGFVIELYQQYERQDIQYQIEDCYKAKIFGSKLIQKCIFDFFNGNKYQLECISFLKIFQNQKNLRLFIRISKQFQEQFLERIQRKARLLNQISISDKQPVRGNRKNLRTEYASISIDQKQFDRKQFKDFIHKSQKLDKKDLQIIETKNSYGYTETFTIKLSCYQDQSIRKLEAFNYYFRHQNFIKLPLKETKHKSDLINKYDKFNKNWLQVKLIRGYKSSKWDDKTLIYKIRCNNISAKKTNYNNQLFQAFHLIGLLPKVREYLEKLQYQINNVPLDDVKEELFLDFSQDIKDALKNHQKIQLFIQGFIKSYSNQFIDVCQVISIKFPLRGVKINVLIKPGKEKEYQQSVKDNLQIVMMKEIRIHKCQLEFAVDQQFLERLQKQGIKVLGHGQKNFTYIEANQNLTTTIDKIQEVQNDFQTFSQQYIQIQGKGKLQKYLELIRTEKDKEQFKMIFVTDPQSNDKIKYKIGFIGQRKKNQAFVKLIKQKIYELQKTFGSYYEAIDSEKANFLINDNFIQQEINKRFNISMMADLSYTLEAKLKIIPLNLNKRIYFYKSKQLNIVPYGSSLYFTKINQLQQFQEKFLDIIKIKSKRMTKKQLIKQLQPSRQLSIFYKNEMNLIELVSNALDLQQNCQPICFIMPKDNKQKFVKEILTILTSSKIYQKKSYQIFIIETDQDSDISKLINLPEYTQLVVKQEIVVEWSCQGKPYSKSGNNKINDAIARGLTKCLLQQDDFYLNLHSQPRSHICDIQKNIITCMSTHQQIPLIKNGEKIFFNYKGYILQFSAKQANLTKSYRSSLLSRFYLSLVYYQLDLANLIQVNIFTGRKRYLQKTQKIIKLNSEEYQNKVQAFYSCNVPHIIYSFEEADSKKLHDAINEVAAYIKSNVSVEIIPLKAMGTKYKNNMEEVIRAKAEQNQLKYEYSIYKNEIKVQSLSKKNIQRFKKIVKSQAEYLLTLQAMEKMDKPIQKSLQTYPSNWEPQTQQIQIFNVLRTSTQFLNVQKLFTVRPIYELFRIQNKFLYKRFLGQLNHLTFLNESKQPKQMMLFHGTHQNDPQNIWGDKEQGFNINYSRDSNLLGRGIYFAEKSQYSFTYKHRENNISNICSMFMCSVIVGDSQELRMSSSNSHVKDTAVKNSNGLKYQSMKGKHDICDIYVVYKDKRAYPTYLIKFKD